MKKETNRQSGRSVLRQRRVWVPERHIARFYKKWDYQRSPEVACNGRLFRHNRWARA